MSGNPQQIQSRSTETAPRKIVWFKFDARAFTMVGALLAIWILFSLLHDRFLTSTNLSNLFLQMSVTAILAIGMVLVIVAGQIDLSVGSLVGFTGGVAAILNVWYHWNPLLVIVVTLLVGAGIGLVQGWIVAYKAVPAFIVTLGGMLIFRGALLGVTGSVTVSSLDKPLKMLGQQYITDIAGWVLGILGVVAAAYLIIRKRVSRAKYGFPVEPMALSVVKIAFFALLSLGFVLLMNDYKGVPVPFLFVIVLAIIFTFIAKNTTFGRHVYAIGGNQEAARLSGINIKRRLLLVFVLGNLLAAIAGLVTVARLNAATMSAGQNYELDAIAACVIGGTSLIGGAGTIGGALIGALVMATLDNGMSLLNMESFWQMIVKGAILILAVYIDIYNRQRKKTA